MCVYAGTCVSSRFSVHFSNHCRRSCNRFPEAPLCVRTSATPVHHWFLSDFNVKDWRFCFTWTWIRIVLLSSLIFKSTPLAVVSCPSIMDPALLGFAGCVSACLLFSVPSTVSSSSASLYQILFSRRMSYQFYIQSVQSVHIVIDFSHITPLLRNPSLSFQLVTFDESVIILHTLLFRQHVVALQSMIDRSTAITATSTRSKSLSFNFSQYVFFRNRRNRIVRVIFLVIISACVLLTDARMSMTLLSETIRHLSWSAFIKITKSAKASKLRKSLDARTVHVITRMENFENFIIIIRERSLHFSVLYADFLSFSIWWITDLLQFFYWCTAWYNYRNQLRIVKLHISFDFDLQFPFKIFLSYVSRLKDLQNTFVDEFVQKNGFYRFYYVSKAILDTTILENHATKYKQCCRNSLTRVNQCKINCKTFKLLYR